MLDQKSRGEQGEMGRVRCVCGVFLVPPRPRCGPGARENLAKSRKGDKTFQAGHSNTAPEAAVSGTVGSRGRRRGRGREREVCCSFQLKIISTH